MVEPVDPFSRVANSTALLWRQGPPRRITSVLNRPIIVSASAIVAMLAERGTDATLVARQRLSNLFDAGANCRLSLELIGKSYHWSLLD
jgi:hypothetical protein